MLLTDDWCKVIPGRWHCNISLITPYKAYIGMSLQGINLSPEVRLVELTEYPSRAACFVSFAVEGGGGGAVFAITTWCWVDWINWTFIWNLILCLCHGWGIIYSHYIIFGELTEQPTGVLALFQIIFRHKNMFIEVTQHPSWHGCSALSALLVWSSGW